MNKKDHKLIFAKGCYTKKSTQSSGWQFDFAKEIYDNWPIWKKEVYGKNYLSNRDEIAINTK